MSATKPYSYVSAITRKGEVIGYGVYDSVHGMVSEHARYLITKTLPWKSALYLANEYRDDRNARIRANEKEI